MFLTQPSSGTMHAFLLLIKLTSTLAQQCYYPDGSESPHDTACNTTASSTNCCAGGEACLSSGLCYMIYDMSINTGTCTDKTWRSPECFNKCPNVDTQAAVNTLYRCSNNKWCCSAGGNTTSCCNDPGVDLFGSTLSTIYNGSAFSPNYTVVPVTKVVSTTTSTSSTSSSASGTFMGSGSCPTATETAAVTCPVRVEGLGEAKMRVGLGVGLGIGVPLLAALGALAVLLARERRRSSESRPRADGVPSGGDVKAADGGWNGHGKNVPWHEMPGGDGINEMAGTDGRRDLSGVRL